ncbi:MAG: DUF2192 domain-containing protein [Crenarchaeota archaeon]|nr:DUF2192 domain-containing protein [Thermoproteota archaeon]
MPDKNPYRKRIQIIVDLLGEIIRKGNVTSREELRELIKETYEKHGIVPIKGKATPPDLYDKEIASLYVIAKYGLALDDEYPSLFDNLFRTEEKYEEAIKNILENNYEEARKNLIEASSQGQIDSNTVARMLRVAFTKLLFGFITEDEFAEILKKTAEAIPEEERTVRNFVRFYIAFKVAEMISRGEIRNKGFKEASKKAIGLRLGFPRIAPRDDYIEAIAKEVFMVPDKVLEKVLLINRDEKKEKNNEHNE